MFLFSFIFQTYTLTCKQSASLHYHYMDDNNFGNVGPESYDHDLRYRRGLHNTTVSQRWSDTAVSLCEINAMISSCCEVRNYIAGHDHTIQTFETNQLQVYNVFELTYVQTLHG